ncbi:hypothetical protein PAMP_012579 [Pampus punctatissimus]
MCLRKRSGYRPPDLINAKISIAPRCGGLGSNNVAQIKSYWQQNLSKTVTGAVVLVELMFVHFQTHTPYTGPIPGEREGELAMGGGRSETSALSGAGGVRATTTTQNSQRPNACCFCWCCCCSCSCTKPSVEEIRLWSQSFDKLMRNPAGRNVFREFLRTEYSEENMLFWLACEDLKQEINKGMIEEKARSIYENYISILSPKEVSLDARVREVINRKMQDPAPHTFEDAQLQIYTLMHRDSYPRFLSSNIYKSLVHGGSRTSSES